MLKRILIMAVVIIFLMTTTVARVFYLTIVRGEELSEKAETQQLKDTEIFSVMTQMRKKSFTTEQLIKIIMNLLKRKSKIT